MSHYRRRGGRKPGEPVLHVSLERVPDAPANAPEPIIPCSCGVIVGGAKGFVLMQGTNAVIRVVPGCRCAAGRRLQKVLKGAAS